MKAASAGDIDTLVEEYYNRYEILPEDRDEKEFRRHVAVQAGIEAVYIDNEEVFI